MERRFEVAIDEALLIASLLLMTVTAFRRTGANPSSFPSATLSSIITAVGDDRADVF